MARFSDRVVLLTGACGGFGRVIAQRMAEEGACLVLGDLDPARLQAMAAGLPGESAWLEGDVAEEESSQRLVDLAVARFGRLDIAINNAGIAHEMGKLHRIDSTVARKVIEIDLLGVFFAMKCQTAVMERQFRAGSGGGTIVNIASVAGISGAPRLSVYSAAKHGVVGLTRSAAAEFAGKDIRVNAVCPSYARTPMVTAALGADGEAAEAELTRGVPMRRLAEVGEIVEVVLFAADPANSFMTGQTLAADGGITAI